MNLLNKLTIKNLKLNKKRTIVTIIGIILATALITAVAGLLTSFRQTMINCSREEDGNYHYRYVNVPKDELKYISSNRNVENYYITQNLGYANLEGSANEYKPYLYLMAYDNNAFKNSSIKLTTGRMPQNNNEIVISEHIINNGKVDYKIGDKVTLDIGKRMCRKYELMQTDEYAPENKETLSKKITKTYEIVGIIKRPNYDIESRSAPGYSVITYLDDNNIEGKTNIYTLYTKNGLNNRYKVTGDILGVSDGLLEKLSKYSLSEQEYEELEKAKYEWSSNDSLLRFEAFDLNESNLSMIYTLSAIVIAIIIVTSIFCIRNSFAISITEKMKQYGMLSSIGATPKQIRKNVLYEAAILSVIGIPLGVLGGMFAVFILLKVIGLILKDALNGITFVFNMSWLAIILAIVLSLITIFLSARKSAKRASKVSPIEAIRSSEDIKMKSKKIKSPKVIKKIFGVGGDIAYKNLKRNNKKYRTTVISIVVSVSIFIAMSCFMNYAFKTSDIYFSSVEYNLIVSTQSLDKDYSKLKEISRLEDVEKFSLQRSLEISINEKDVKFSERGKEFYNKNNKDEENKSDYIDIRMVSLGEGEYNRYIEKLGLNYKNVKDKAILIDDAMEYVTDEKGRSLYQNFNVYEYRAGDKLNGKISKDNKNNKDIEIKIAKVTKEKPMGLESSYYNSGCIIVSDEWINQNSEYICKNASAYLKANNAGQMEDNIKQINKSNIEVYNYEDSVKAQNALWLVISIFLYGFITVISLIGITNIFNTITTNMNLRSKEFANLKSIGMTKSEFNRMIRLESIFYGTKSLIIGVPIGIGLSYGIYKGFAESAEMGFLFPTSGVVISIIAVFLLILGIMRYSLNKINKQNIIETIRKDNI